MISLSEICPHVLFQKPNFGVQCLILSNAPEKFKTIFERDPSRSHVDTQHVNWNWAPIVLRKLYN
jgi:hypothetical protein